jgi:hypothetical protein
MAANNVWIADGTEGSLQMAISAAAAAHGWICSFRGDSVVFGVPGFVKDLELEDFERNFSEALSVVERSLNRGSLQQVSGSATQSHNPRGLEWTADGRHVTHLSG